MSEEKEQQSQSKQQTGRTKNQGGAATQRKSNYNKIKEAIPHSAGLLTTIAQKASLTRRTVYSYYTEYEELREEIEHERQTRLDDSEGRLFKAIQNDESWAIKFHLESQGKDRGYGKRTEITGAQGGKIEVVWPDDEE